MFRWRCQCGGNVDLDLGDGVRFERAKKCCYLGDMFKRADGADLAVIAGMKCA